MRNNHKPDIEFVSGLERQLTSELRRNRRFSSVETSSGMKRFIKTSILFIACAATGVAAAKTVEHIESSKRRILHVARIEAVTEQLQARQGVVQGMVDELKGRVEAGLIHQDELVDAAIQSKLIDYELERALLNLEEVHMSGEAPADELYAPLQGGRDFVTERLQIDLRKAEMIKRHIEEQGAEMQKLVEAGLLHQEETRDMDLQIEGAESELEDIQHRIDLRRDYLSGDLSAREISVRQMTQEARSRLDNAESMYRTTEAQLKKVSELHAKGLVPIRDVRQAEYHMINARSECRIAEIELELLEERLEE
jgi:hypothetical protein